MQKLLTVVGHENNKALALIHVGNDELGGQKLAEPIANARHKITELIAA